MHGITGVEVGDMTAKVDPNSGNITEYHTACNPSLFFFFFYKVFHCLRIAVCEMVLKLAVYDVYDKTN
ncbi:MAG TPA: hypothetical protein VE619_11550 [Nitrososphaeraceae archaeon]|nr:hypothetical protein [Nitrososphaeraceae archaeon]